MPLPAPPTGCGIAEVDYDCPVARRSFTDVTLHEFSPHNDFSIGPAVSVGPALRHAGRPLFGCRLTLPLQSNEQPMRRGSFVGSTCAPISRICALSCFRTECLKRPLNTLAVEAVAQAPRILATLINAAVVVCAALLIVRHLSFLWMSKALFR